MCRKGNYFNQPKAQVSQKSLRIITLVQYFNWTQLLTRLNDPAITTPTLQKSHHQVETLESDCSKRRSIDYETCTNSTEVVRQKCTVCKVSSPTNLIWMQRSNLSTFPANSSCSVLVCSKNGLSSGGFSPPAPFIPLFVLSYYHH